MQHHLVVLDQVCSNNGFMAKKWPNSGNHVFFIALYIKNIKSIFLSETLGLRTLVLGLNLVSVGPTLWLSSTGFQLLDLFYSSIQLHILLSPYHFISRIVCTKR